MPSGGCTQNDTYHVRNLSRALDMIRTQLLAKFDGGNQTSHPMKIIQTADRELKKRKAMFHIFAWKLIRSSCKYTLCRVYKLEINTSALHKL